MAGSDDIMSVLQNIAQALTGGAKAQSQVTPDFTSGVLGATTLINLGFTRVTSVIVSAAGAAGWLHDTNAVTSIGTSTRVYPVAATLGHTATNMIFKKGLVYEPGAAQQATVMFAKE